MATKTRHGFDFCRCMRRLGDDITRRTPELRHIEFSRVAISYSQTRKRVRHGLWASLTPMRFEGGARFETRDGRTYGCQQLLNSRGDDVLYILTFYLPRFLDLSPKEKLVTVFHELWHISPKFDGDIRRHPGRCYAHSRSEKEYDTKVEEIACQWLSRNPPPDVYAFLKLGFAELQQRYGTVIASRLRRPHVFRVD